MNTERTPADALNQYFPVPAGSIDTDPRQLITQLDPQDLVERSRVVSLPLRTRFRGITRRDVVLIEGPAGWAEWAPFREYDDDIAGQWLLSTIDMAYNQRWYPDHSLPPVAVNGTIPACAPEDVEELLQRYQGCQTIKVKVAEPGQSLADDVARVTAVHQHVPEALIRVDANGAWSVEEALRAAQAFRDAVDGAGDGALNSAVNSASGDAVRTDHLDYLEQPCATRAELAELRSGLQREGIAVDVAADESIRRAEDPYRVIREGACDVAVVKAPPLGGPRRVADVATAAHQAGLRVTLSSALDSAVGMYAGLCAALISGSGPAGLATGGLFDADVVAAGQRRAVRDGVLETQYLPADGDALAAVEADKDTTSLLQARLVRATRAAAAAVDRG